ncbi:hypothetical protein Ddye_006982 [Dipteronia dyeriana]|uniref:Uncharacterized protein n=1 Tax=Dipteronia dyeriana TaxID=168575 RepID=A0AAD9XJ40_9ROSI|nr:hypothetical protein Ddye_006982 [Dipteronia dyeriana]
MNSSWKKHHTTPVIYKASPSITRAHQSRNHCDTTTGAYHGHTLVLASKVYIDSGVSKQWSFMINDPRFVKLLLAQTRRYTNFWVEKSLYSIDLDNFLNTKSYEKLKVHPAKLDVLKENPDEYRNEIFGSDGLFCLNDEDDYGEAFFIYNPFPRESKKIFYL